ncbi:MAG: GatB/YqeY domain-containing protein [Chloroherpetonaceae bacterium]|nr:GatB/YqeY domain-containing protein [Chloroherpetonaceae bacterium]
MTLKERINEEIKAAMKSGDKTRLETVRDIKKHIIEKETAEKRAQRGELTPEEELEVLTAMAKRRRDSIEEFEKAGRTDLAEKEKAELAVIQEFLPKQLSEEEIKEVLKRIIAEVGAATQKDVGKVMGVAMKELKGKAEGSAVQKLVKELLPA